MASQFEQMLKSAKYVLGFLLFCTALRSEALQTYALTCIGNATNFRITYFVRWGKGEWTRVSVAPQRWMWHTWSHNQSRESPELLVRYDADPGEGQTWIVSPLKKYASPSRGNSGDCERHGKRYQFAQERGLIRLTTLDYDSPGLSL